MLKAFYRFTKNPEEVLIAIKALTSTKKTWLIDRYFNIIKTLIIL